MIELDKIYNIDCLQGIKQIDSNSVDLVVTSPPYNIGIDYGGYNDKKEWDKYELFIRTVLKDIHRICKDNAIFAINVGNQRNSGLPHHIYFWLKEMKTSSN